MTRRLLADPDFPNKVIEGRPEDVRPCTGCLHCFDMRNRNKKLECRVNATLGRETMPEFQLRPARPAKKVLVVGGGPAGMEAARVAARRGHQVALYEKDDRLGGLVPLAAIVKDLETQELVDLVRYLEGQIRKEGVVVRTRQPVTAELVRRLRPDALIIGAGAAHTELDVPGVAGSKVVPSEKLHGMLKAALKVLTPAQIARLSDVWMPVGKSVVIMGGTLHGCELAEFLTKKGRRIVVAHDGPASELGDGMTIDDLESLWPWLKQKHVPHLGAGGVRGDRRRRPRGARSGQARLRARGRAHREHPGLVPQHGDRREARRPGRGDARRRQRRRPAADRRRHARRSPCRLCGLSCVAQEGWRACCSRAC